MFGSRAAAKTLDNVVSDLTQRVQDLSEENGSLKTENRYLTAQNGVFEQTIHDLQSQIESLKEMQNELLSAAAKLGVNLNPVISGYDLWLSRGLALAEAYIKSDVCNRSIPDFDVAMTIDSLKPLICELPGFNPDELTAAKEQYQYLQLEAQRLII